MAALLMAAPRTEPDPLTLESHTSLIQHHSPELSAAVVLWLSTLDVTGLDAVSTYQCMTPKGTFLAQVHDQYDETEVSQIIPITL